MKHALLTAVVALVVGYSSNATTGTSRGPVSPGDGGRCTGARTRVDPTPYGKITGTVGRWQNVTPAGIDLNVHSFNNDNYGAQDVLVDPVRPSDFYAFLCHQGVWKSTDYGATWKKVNTGVNGDKINQGKPWGSAIDTSWCRDPNKPPTLYTLAGSGPMGFWRSTDGGVSWRQFGLPKQGHGYDQDAYMIAVDPYDGQHLLMGFHEAAGLVESTNGGSTWTHLTPADDGVSEYYSFVDTGDPATTRRTWLGIGQSGAMHRTADAGQTWKQVEALQHAHGCNTMVQSGDGVIYIAGMYGSKGNGIYRSTDYGRTFDIVSQRDANGVLATATTLYASYAWAVTDATLDPALQTAPRARGTPWTRVPTPPGMTNGWKGGATSTDGTHHVIVTGNWNSGFWRYVE